MESPIYQRDKDGNIIRMRIIAENIDVVHKYLDEISEEWRIILFITDKKGNRKVAVSRYGKGAEAIKISDLRIAIAEKMLDGISWNEAFYNAISNIREIVDEYGESEYIPLPDIENIAGIQMYAEKVK